MKKRIVCVLAALFTLLACVPALASSTPLFVFEAASDGTVNIYKNDELIVFDGEGAINAGTNPNLTLTKDRKGRLTAGVALSDGTSVREVTLAKGNVSARGAWNGIDLQKSVDKSTFEFEQGSIAAWIKIASRGKATVYGTVGTLAVDYKRASVKLDAASVTELLNVTAGSVSVSGTVTTVSAAGKYSKITLNKSAVIAYRLVSSRGSIKASDDREPEILIYSTHSREAYTPTKKYRYKESSEWRTKDQRKSVIRVGKELKEYLEETYGYVVIQDKTDHEPLTNAYDRSYLTMVANKEKYPSLRMFIDVHRDAGSRRKTATVDGDRLARLMFVVGKGVNFVPAPDFQSNYALASAIGADLLTLSSDLVRPMPDKTNRYNQHVSDKCLLIEVGDNMSYMEDALNAMPYLAWAIAKNYGF